MDNELYGEIDNAFDSEIDGEIDREPGNPGFRNWKLRNPAAHRNWIRTSNDKQSIWFISSDSDSASRSYANSFIISIRGKSHKVSTVIIGNSSHSITGSAGIGIAKENVSSARCP